MYIDLANIAKFNSLYMIGPPTNMDQRGFNLVIKTDKEDHESHLWSSLFSKLRTTRMILPLGIM